MNKRPAAPISFKCPHKMHRAVKKIMDEHSIDRSSVIKLALYHFINHTQKTKRQRMNIFELVASLENEDSKHPYEYYNG